MFQTILVIDDNPQDQQLIARKLTNLHVEVNIGDNLEAGYKLAKEINPSVILLDANLPVRFEGPKASVDQVLEFVRFQREKSCIVVLTGDAAQANLEQFYEAGVMDYIGKDRIMVDSELVNRIRAAHQLHADIGQKKDNASMALQIAVLRSNSEKIIFLMRKESLKSSDVRDRDDRRKFEQAFSAGKIVGMKEHEARFWKKMGLWVAAIVSVLWAFYNFCGGFLKGMMRH